MKMRLKFDNEEPNAYRCCFCCHVRTGTIILGLWHLLANLFVMCLLVIATVHPELLKVFRSSSPIEFDRYLLKEDQNNWEPYKNGLFDSIWRSKEDLCVVYAITLCSTTMCVLLIYGAVKNRPGYLIPFFGLQVFDFCLSCLTIVGSSLFTTNIKVWLKEQRLDNCPGFQRLMEMDSDLQMLLIVIFIVVFLLIRAYCLGVIWSCYKYAQLVSAGRNLIREYRVDPDTEMLLPPSYEDAIKVPLSELAAMSHSSQQVPPPPYMMSLAPVVDASTTTSDASSSSSMPTTTTTTTTTNSDNVEALK
ncbi:lysosomal-associated transmembrane protein 4A-like isoform X2 [Octopus vulgaris]|uniref:Lysosomal-associated transmembrane protein 4A-like isoform X2 n=1 Tax=Octopus vulgaris TaxID=6645 RepID=A0AA36BF21_OCTVU|nr:lysosomal-associated transmembrane protein 4A-like isoform X2 [Octopus vulgaris]